MLEFTLRNQTIERIDSFKPVGKSLNYLRCRFVPYSGEWALKEAFTAVFTDKDGKSYNVIVTNYECEVPWEVLDFEEAFEFTVSVYVDDRITTNEVTVEVDKTGFRQGSAPSDPTPNVYDQIIGKLEKTIEDANKILVQVKKDAAATAENAKAVNNVDIEANKIGNTANIIFTDRFNHKKHIEIKDGLPGKPGNDYVLTEADKRAIADMAKPVIDSEVTEDSLNPVSSRGIYEFVQQSTSDKMEFYKVDFNGSQFVKDGEVLTYADLVQKYNDDRYFLFAEGLGYTMIPSLPPLPGDEILEFSCAYIYQGKTSITRAIINSNNEVKYETYNMVKDTDKAAQNVFGLVSYVGSTYGVSMSDGNIRTAKATESDIDAGTNGYKPIVPNTLNYAVIKALKNNSISLTDSEKLAIETWLGLSENYLTYYNATPYLVNADYIPAHKKYVDEQINKPWTKIEFTSTSADRLLTVIENIRCTEIKANITIPQIAATLGKVGFRIYKGTNAMDLFGATVSNTTYTSHFDRIDVNVNDKFVDYFASYHTNSAANLVNEQRTLLKESTDFDYVDKIVLNCSSNTFPVGTKVVLFYR